MKKLTISMLLTVIAVALVVLLPLHRLATMNRAEEIRILNDTDRATLGTEHDQSRSLRRERSRKVEEERQAALDLAKRIGEKQSLISPNRMSRVGDKERSPSALIDEAANMKGSQLRTLVLGLGKNPKITGSNRALLVASVTDAWLKEHEAGGTQSLKEVLEIIAEVLPTLPRGFDTLPVSCAMGRSLEWNHPEWVDFIEAHWSRWSGPNGNANAEVLRRDLLKVLDDPQLRKRVERLPQAGAGN